MSVSVTFACWVVFVGGCGSGRLATFPVEGSVTVDGVPVKGINVYFHPGGGSEEFQRQRPYAETDENGEFRLTTFVRGDGAPTGKYCVTFTWFEQDEAVSDESGDPERRRRSPVKDKLDGRYGEVSDSRFDVEILPEHNRLEPFHLTITDP